MLKEIFFNIIGNAIVQAGRSIKIYNLKMFKKNKFEVTPEQYLILNMLGDDTNLNQNKLCQSLYKDKSNMTRLLAILEERSLIEKVKQKDNNKIVNKIRLTEHGKELKERITPFMHKSREKYLKDISADDIYICIKVLSKIHENLVCEE